MTEGRTRYDGLAEWYDAFFAGYAEGSRTSAEHLETLLGVGSGTCLDVGCGTGLHFAAIRAVGYDPIGVDVSADQLLLARERAPMLVQADAAFLPFADGLLRVVVATWLHTDVDDFSPIVIEIARILAPGGRFVYLGAHPCFVGFFVETRVDGSRVVHPGYRDAGWHFDSPFYGEGLRRRIGERHTPLGELLNSVAGAGLRLERVVEPDIRLEVGGRVVESVIPWALGFVATKD